MTMKHATKSLTGTLDFLPETQHMSDGYLKNTIYHLFAGSACTCTCTIYAQYDTSGPSHTTRPITFCPFSRPYILGIRISLLCTIYHMCVYRSQPPFFKQDAYLKNR